MCREFAGAKAGLVEALPPARAPIEAVEIVALAVFGPGLRGQFEMRLDQVARSNEHG